jgi:2-isopropylmalate synthase
MKQILDRVVELESEGYQFEAAEASFDLLVRKCAGLHKSRFQRIHYRVNVQMDQAPEAGDVPGTSSVTTEAIVKVRVGDRIEHVAGEGDGPVNALDNALRKALVPTYPELGSMKLVDYKVRVINSAEGTAARVRVVIECVDDEEAVWSTVGVSENVIEASWIALVDAYEHKLSRNDNGV